MGINLPNGNEVEEIILPNGANAREVIGPNGERVFGGPAIPDSEANQKLRNRWLYGQNEPFADQIGSADATNNGTTEISGDWVDGAARDGDGVGDWVGHTTLGSFGSSMDTGFAVGLSFAGTEGLSGGAGNSLLGTFNDGSNTAIQIPDAGNNNRFILIRDDSGNDARVLWSNASNFEDGEPHRIIVNIPDTTNASTYELWVDQFEESLSIDSDTSPGDFSDFEFPLSFFARNVRGSILSHTDCILDDICLFEDSLTQSEIESYQTPWQ